MMYEKYSISIPSMLPVCTDAFVLNVDGVVPALNLKSSWGTKLTETKL